MAGREGMFISGRFLVLTFVVAVFAGMHCVIEVITNCLLQGIPFSEVVLLVAWMAGHTVETFRFMVSLSGLH